MELEELKKEKEVLNKIVDHIFELDMLTMRRFQGVVEARMVFSKILSDRGHSITSIGRYLSKNHATIIYYNKHISFLIENYSDLFNKYIQCKSAFLEGRDPIVMLKERDIQVMVSRLQDKIEELVREKEELRAAIRKHKRFEKIIELLHNKAKVGDEMAIYNRLNSMLNA